MDSQESAAPIAQTAPDADFAADVLDGLSGAQKRIPSKYLYDARGSELFERICEQPEYYPTRTELGILQSEGAAIAAYVQKNMRVPRRGEIGLKSTEIEKFEAAGYVMSGSRHARMNAVRIRKENQVYSAEEKRALALITFEEKQQTENKTMAQFRDMLTKRLRDQDKDS